MENQELLGRIILIIQREAYFEDPCYVPLVKKAYKLWDELEKASKRKLFTQTGGLMLSSPKYR